MIILGVDIEVVWKTATIDISNIKPSIQEIIDIYKHKKKSHNPKKRKNGDSAALPGRTVPIFPLGSITPILSHRGFGSNA